MHEGSQCVSVAGVENALPLQDGRYDVVVPEGKGALQRVVKRLGGRQQGAVHVPVDCQKMEDIEQSEIC